MDWDGSNNELDNIWKFGGQLTYIDLDAEYSCFLVCLFRPPVEGFFVYLSVDWIKDV